MNEFASFFASLPDEPRARRELLIDEMARLEAEGRDCRQCSGVCCTLVANSMMTTPLETAELLRYLYVSGRWNASTRARLAETVRHFRLDQEPPGDGRRSFARRTYTCPFYGDQALGCSLSRAAKPYGCLGFNPRSPGLTEGGDCASDQGLLERREQDFFEQERAHNAAITQALALDWEKLPMPLALLRLADSLQATQAVES